MKPVHVALTPEELAALVARVEAKEVAVEIAGSSCVACGKVLGPDEMSIRGYASGEELALCRGCASHVNTEQAVNQALKEGHKVDVKAVIAPVTKKDKNHAPC